MSIEKGEFEFEKGKLKTTQKWIENERILADKNDNELKMKIAELKKESRGRYSEELETAQKLYAITHKNLEKYIETKDEPYFARIDFRERLRDNESFYIGKFGLGDSKTGDEIVIDWRAPIADLYYSKTQGEASYEVPDGFIDGELNMKRKFLIRERELADAFDEGINEIILKSADGENTLTDEFLKINLEESVSSKLKDVVATIQKEQNDIIRAGKNAPLIVQGSAGSGKTTIALHRLAYLLYKYNKTLAGKDILVIAPNKLFLDYISMVLPSLGIDMVKQMTFEELAVKSLKIKGKVITKDKKLSSVLESKEKNKYITESSKFKGSLFYKTILDRYIRYIEIEDANVDNINVNGFPLFKASEIKRLFVRDMAHLPLDKRKDEIKKYFNNKLKEKLPEFVAKISADFEYKIATVKNNMEDGEERRKIIIQIYDERDIRKKQILKLSRESMEIYFDNWKHSDTKKLLQTMFENEEIIGRIAEQTIPIKLWRYIRDEFQSNEENGSIDSDDLTTIMYLKFKLEGVPEGYIFKHIVIDEAQDYSAFQYAVIRHMATNDSFTIVGDTGQGIYFYKGINSWENLIKDVFNNSATYVQLTQSYRSTVEIIKFANKVLKKQENSLKPAMPVLRHGMEPEVINFKGNKDFSDKLDDIVKLCDKRGKNSVAIIGRTYEECKTIKEFLKKYSKHNWELIKDTEKNVKMEKIIIPSYMTKGLEFDCSVIYNCNKDNYDDNELDKKILYVSLTRALHLEYVCYEGDISPLLD
ncbi:RNA polymerase recycling motor HelD [Clostridium akagii]|uniref:RNA polymerase recycling motor HelD n=1 Tax=Clostridium akagii TaxID=91623 RepID=UPI00047A70B2|nr:RNA polymerase recycling motor HelD [Clostridium akagii]